MKYFKTFEQISSNHFKEFIEFLKAQGYRQFDEDIEGSSGFTQYFGGDSNSWHPDQCIAIKAEKNEKPIGFWKVVPDNDAYAVIPVIRHNVRWDIKVHDIEELKELFLLWIDTCYIFHLYYDFFKTITGSIGTNQLKNNIPYSCSLLNERKLVLSIESNFDNKFPILRFNSSQIEKYSMENHNKRYGFDQNMIFLYTVNFYDGVEKGRLVDFIKENRDKPLKEQLELIKHFLRGFTKMKKFGF